MAIATTDLLFVLSGGNGNTNAAASLGGVITSMITAWRALFTTHAHRLGARDLVTYAITHNYAIWQFPAMDCQAYACTAQIITTVAGHDVVTYLEEHNG